MAERSTPWVKMRSDLPEDPQVLCMVDALDSDLRFKTWLCKLSSPSEITVASEYVPVAAINAIVIRGLLRVWSLARTKSVIVDGDAILERAKIWSLDEIGGVPGLGHAMADAGWVVQLKPSGLRFPGFAKQNIVDEERVRERWKLQKQSQRNRGKMSGGQEGGQSGGCPVVSTPHSTVQDSTEEKKKSPLPLADTSPTKAPAPKRSRAAAKRDGSDEKPGDEMIPVVEKKPRTRNLTFDAIAEVCGADPAVRSMAKLIGTAAADVTAAGYSADQVREFGRRFWELCPWARSDGRDRPTPGELAKWISKLNAQAAPGRPIGGKPDPITDLATRSLLAAMEAQDGQPDQDPDGPF